VGIGGRSALAAKGRKDKEGEAESPQMLTEAISFSLRLLSAFAPLSFLPAMSRGRPRGDRQAGEAK